MVVYNFKKMASVPPAEDLIDIILTRTQRKTPTVIHPGYKISRIRSFYMRKVKFTQETISERLGAIIGDFPRLDDIHPFYADLLNILYDRDHYKLALGQMNMAKKLVEALSRDYVRLLKYGDSLYRCKQLKRAALGRMCTLLKRQKASLSYLEEVRRHLARLPALDPNTRTLLLTGFPNVGKSSFMNKVTRAEVDVQPYAFTTKSLYVGHMDYRYLRWQVVDTPGILDHPLEERNTIEMQAVTALAHLQCCVLYFIDISEQCGYTIKEQVSLFESIKPLFANKQLLVIANKTDVAPFADIKEEDRVSIEKLADSAGVELHLMSNETEEGVQEVKTAACDKLLQARVDARMAGKKVGGLVSRLTVAMPKARDGRDRAPTIPASVVAKRAAAAAASAGGAGSSMDVDGGEGGRSQPTARKTEKDLMWENGGPGVYSCDYRKYYDLKDDAWKMDRIPEIMDGKNVADYVDQDIDAKLALLEQEEDQLQAEAEANKEYESDVDEDERALAQAIRDRSKVIKKESRARKSRNAMQVPRTNRPALKMDEAVAHLEGLGVHTEGIRGRATTRKRGRSLGPAGGEDEEGGADGQVDGKKTKRSDSVVVTRTGGSRSRSRGPTQAPRDIGLKDESQRKAAEKIMRSGRKERNRFARAGEADRKEGPKLVKHLLAGKMGLGTRRSR
ncbi:Nog1, nucleolar GTPase [Ectocarpus siliculosus]|uniref:Nucleolar GTP-binding protein 1 n=1 Tax=Ectocarpus siliculosus TaxID=2880 RepID=D7FIR4_ECTSI|nr:Nog1, nucleolar GTPase [Ectocarpus siliculosus]|eukprot:CBJ28881.1 Nog1, nucleolar GTPase [Ectocarpus siliculosus]